MSYLLKIDIAAHIQPIKYKEVICKLPSVSAYQRKRIESLPTIFDMEQRFRIMDKYEGLMQVLTLNPPPSHEIANSKKAVDLSKLANDEMAELVLKYPDRFATAVASIPMNNIDAALEEIDRAINSLQFKGIMIFTSVNGKPLDLPEFMPLFEKMARYNLPIFMHPRRPADEYPDYKTEAKSLHRIHGIFGYPYETSVAMTRLVYCGIFEKYPGLKIITHHCGGMIPFFEQRLLQFYGLHELRRAGEFKERLPKPVLDYFKLFYNDTALYGAKPALMCGYEFFGADHMLFGTDMPHDGQLGDRSIRETINAVEKMEISDLEKQKIFEINAKKLFCLTV
ncbi:amidohydrolase family protein [Chloroflexota bacterium]